MKWFKGWATIIILALMSCSSYEDLKPEVGQDIADPMEQNVWQITNDVNSVEVGNIIKHVFANIGTSRSDGYSVSLIKSENGDDNIICINFDNDGGFLLVSAVKTYSPILAYSRKGNFDVDGEMPDNLLEWISATENGIKISQEMPEDSIQNARNEWRVFEQGNINLQSRAEDFPSEGGINDITQEEYVALTRIMMSKMSEWSREGYRTYPISNYSRTLSVSDASGVNNYIQANIYPLYFEHYRDLSIIVEKDFLSKTVKPDILRTKWTQENGFNQVFPYKDDKPNEQIPVGCGPLAIGQIMFAYGYPQPYDWLGMSAGGYGNLTTSKFLYDVFEKCNAKYNPKNKGTECTQAQAFNALKEYGYTCTNVGKSGITESLLNDNPVIMASTITRYVRDSSYENEVV